jgi:tRNA (guanine37-N1)-methyltransferase
MNVEIREEDCTFRFDYSQVYWNSRLNTEHRRLVALFDPGSVVCDVMAGVGPFALPAAEKGVFVWANDLNPASIASLRDAITLNKVEPFVHAFNTDGHAFIHQCAQDLLSLSRSGENKVSIPAKQPRMSRSQGKRPTPPPPTILEIPSTISHFVMNLPATALTFLPAFRGVYAGQEALFAPHTATRLPMVHAHCFSTKSEDNVREGHEIAGIVSEMLGVEMAFEGAVEKVEGDPGKRAAAAGEVADGKVRVHDVRDVAPLKRMFCASFRIPAEVAFAKV